MNIGRSILPFVVATLASVASLAEAQVVHGRAELVGTIEAPEHDSEFGEAIDVKGNVALIGAPHVKDAEGTPRGTAYVFDAESGDLIRKLTSAPKELPGSGVGQFGADVALHGQQAIVSAYLGNDEEDDGSDGCVLVYNAKPGNRLQIIPEPDSERETPDPKGNRFGRSLAAANKRLVIGARDSNQLGDEAGIAFLYRKTDDGWELMKPLMHDSIENNAHFGTDIAMSKRYIAISAPGQYDSPGAVYVFDRNGRFVKQLRMPREPGMKRPSLGTPVAIDGSRLLVGADFSWHKSERLGGAHLFNLDDNGSAKYLTAGDDELFQIGTDVAIEDKYVVISAVGRNISDLVPGRNVKKQSRCYVLSRDTGKVVATLFPSSLQMNKHINEIRGTRFGEELATSGQYVLVGGGRDFAFKDNRGKDVVFVYRVIGQ